MNKNCFIILPNQLFKESLFLKRDNTAFIIEEYMFFKQYNFHKQKISFHRATMKFYEDYLILYATPPPQSPHESKEAYQLRLKEAGERSSMAENGRNEMRQTLAASKLEVAQYVEKYGKYFLVRWRELGNRPALQFYNEAINSAPESEAARLAEKKVAELRAKDEQ